MYGVDSRLPFASLRDEKLLQVCIGENECILRFTNDISVLITSRMRIYADRIYEIDSYRESAAQLCQLLGGNIKAAAPEGARSLAINFDNGSTLVIEDDSDEFESFVLNIGKSKFIV